MKQVFRGIGLALPAWAWLLFFFVIPVATVLFFSFGYKPNIIEPVALDRLSLDRYVEALDDAYLPTVLNTLYVGIVGTLLTLVIAMPAAYWMAVKAPESRRGLLIALIMIPFWTNFLVRTIGWQIILAPQGILADILHAVGLLGASGQLEILNTRGAVLIGVVYNYLPMMILPLFVAFDRVSGPLREAGKDLGADRLRTFATVTLPLAKPGIIAGILLVFIPLMGDYITATVLGGAQGQMLGQIVASQFQTGQNWALGSAMAVILILLIVVSIGLGSLIVWLVGLLFGGARLEIPPAKQPEAVAAASATEGSVR